MTQATKSSSSASSIVVAAAERIQFAYPRSILDRLEKESIQEDWQLQYLDSIQWQALEVPMGLVSSIRRCLEERKRSRSSSATDTRFPPVTPRSPIPRIHSSLFQLPPCENNFLGHSELMKSLRCKSSPMEISFDEISFDGMDSLPFPLSPKSHANQDSLSTFLPPSMPTRRSSDGIISVEMHHWTFGLNDLSAPPVAPKRHESVD
jgi:hypothetical protein